MRIPYNAVAVLEESDPLVPLKGTSPFWEGGEGDDTYVRRQALFVSLMAAGHGT